MDDKRMVGARELYCEATENLRFAKSQQWTLSYYTLFLYAGIYGAHLLLRRRLGADETTVLSTVDCIAIAFAVFSLLGGLGIIFSYQCWMQKERQRLNRLYRFYADAPFIDANREQGGTQFVDASLGRDPHVWVPLVVLQIAAAVWLVYLVYSKYGLPLNETLTARILP
jgi:hypothetical protein